MIKHALRFRRHIATAASVTFLTLALAPAAHASGSSMPWEAPLQSILESIEGPVAKIIAVMIIIITGLTLAFGDTSGGARKLLCDIAERVLRARLENLEHSYRICRLCCYDGCTNCPIDAELHERGVDREGSDGA